MILLSGGIVKMRSKSLIVLFGALLMLTSIAYAQSEWVGVTIDRTQIDDVDVYPWAWSHVSFERGQELELEFHLRAIEDAEDVEIEASIKGYEYSSEDPVRASIGPFDLDEGVTYIKRMDLRLPENLDEDEYLLRVRISDRNSWETTVEYNLKVDVPRHKLSIKDAILTPSGNVEAGRALLASVRVENDGEKDEDDVKVTVSIPDYGISASDYIENIEYDEQEETEDLYLRLPQCAEPGEHVVRIDVFYDNNREQVSAATKINVLENEACAPEEPPVVVVDQQPPADNVEETVAEEVVDKPVKAKKSKIRTALEIVLLVLVGLLILVGLVIGFSRMRAEE